MFVLTHTADVVRGSNNPFMGIMLLATLVASIVWRVVELVRDRKK